MVVLQYLVLAYILAIVGVIILSWFPREPGTFADKVFTFCWRITDPVLGPVRRVLPPVGGALDLSPMIVLFVLWMIYGLLAA